MDNKKKKVHLKNTPRVPRGKGMVAIKKREKIVERHIKKIYGVAYCNALNSDVAFNSKTSRREAIKHSTGDHKSTIFVLNIVQLLRKAEVVEYADPKEGNRTQAPFDKMIILKANIARYGYAKITIGRYSKSTNIPAPYCHYCVTRWMLKQDKKKKRIVT